VRKAAIIVVLAALLAAAAIFLVVRTHTRGDGSVVRVSGNIEITSAEVSFKVPGRVAERTVTEGDSVQAGQLVARLDSADLAQQVAARRAELALATAALAELEAGSRPEEIAQGRAALDRARADATRAQLEFTRVEAMLAQKLVSQQAFDVADAANKSAQAAARQAAAQLRLLEKGPRREDKDQGRARVEQARQALALAETQLGYATVTSPLTGMVMSKNTEPGEFVSPGTPVVTVGDIAHPWLRAYISESDLGRVKLGQSVKVTTDSYPGRTYEGRITFIASQAEFTPKNVQTEKERVKLVYRIKVELPNPKMELKPGMPADAEIALGPQG
jgi:HlyD family secretion protein